MSNSIQIKQITEKKEYQNMQKPKYLRSKELAIYLGIGESTVWLYVKQGKLIKHKISAKVTLFDVYQAEKSLNLI
jgi:hypothetical protein